MGTQEGQLMDLFAEFLGEAGHEQVLAAARKLVLRTEEAVLQLVPKGLAAPRHIVLALLLNTAARYGLEGRGVVRKRGERGSSYEERREGR